VENQNRIWRVLEKAGLCSTVYDKAIKHLIVGFYDEAFPIIEAELLPKPCVWMRKATGVDFWAPQCEESPSEHLGLKFFNYKLCPYCGGKITEPPKGE